MTLIESYDVQSPKHINLSCGCLQAHVKQPCNNHMYVYVAKGE